MKPYLLLLALLLTSCHVPSDTRRTIEERDCQRHVAAWVESAEGREAIVVALEERIGALMWGEVSKMKATGGASLAAAIAGGWGLVERLRRKNGKAKGKVTE